MLAVQRDSSIVRFREIGLAVGLAALAAVAYILIGQGVLGVGNLNTEDAPAAITYVCAGCYLLGGLLILPRWRWLWVVGAVINALVMTFFFSMYSLRPDVLLSAGGLTTKAAQVLLELALVYLIFSFRPAPKR